jgi:hypothetical protein
MSVTGAKNTGGALEPARHSPHLQIREYRAGRARDGGASAQRRAADEPRYIKTATGSGSKLVNMQPIDLPAISTIFAEMKRHK